MILKSLTLQNFLGYREKTELEFKNKHTVGIVGPNESGKSSLLQAIRYVLYGKSQAEREAQLINNSATGHLLVKASFVFDDKKELNVTRGRTKKGEPILKVAGISGSPSQLQSSINERLKLCHDDFIALTYFVQKDIDQFMVGNKRSYFQRWTSNLQVWEYVHVEAKNSLSELEKKREKLTIAIDQFKSEAGTLQKYVSEEKEIIESVKSLNTEIEHVRNKVKKRSKLAHSSMQTLQKLYVELVETNSELRDSKSASKRFQTELNEAKKGVCPLLEVRCDKLRDDKLPRVRKRLQESLVRVKTLQNEVQRLKEKVKVLEAKKPDTSAENENSKLQALERRLRRFLVQQGEVRANRERAVRAKKQVDILTGEIKHLDKAISAIRFVVYMCGNSGVPSILIENALSEVETKCNWVLQRLDSQKRITFRSYKELGGLEKLCPKCGSESWMKGICKTCGLERPHKLKYEPTVVITDQMGERPFALESGGAQTLESFAVRLACSLFVESMSGASFDLIMLDEIFAHLDSENRQKLLILIVDKLASEFGLKQQFIVSHHDDVTNTVDDIIEVKKDRRGSIARWM